MFIGDEANPFKAHREDFREAPKAPSNVIPFPSDRARLTEMEAEVVRFAAAFSKLPREEQRRVWFAGRLAGRSATEAFNRPRVPHAVGADSYYRERGEAEAPKKEKRKGPKLEPAPDAPEPKAENFVDELARPPTLFIYHNPDGSVHSFVARWGTGKAKKMLPFFWGEGEGRAPGWVNQRHPSPILYRLPEVVEGVRLGKTVVFLEGEKDVHGAIERFGEELYVFTTTPGGALNTKHWAAWEGVDYSPLGDARTLLVPDPDGDGRAWCRGIAHILTRMNGATKPPAAIEVGTIPPMSKGWHNGDGKPWGFADRTPGCATDADIERILTGAVPLEEWLRPFDEPPPPHPDDPGPGTDPRDAPPRKFELVRYRFIQPTLSGLWRIKGLLPARGLVTVFGEPGCGKSFMALDMVMHIAAPLDYLGRRVRKGRVVYIAAEGQGAFRNRVVACGRKLCLEDTQFDLIEVAPNLGVKGGDAPALIQAIEAATQPEDLPVACIVVDTTSQAMGGENENNEGMATFIVNVNTISNHFESLSIAVHHTGKVDTVNPRGWSGLHAANDVEIRVSGTTGSRTAEITKQKDGDGLGFSFQFELERTEVGIDEEDNTPVTTCIVANLRALPRLDAEEVAAKRKAAKQPRRSLRVFEAAFEQAMVLYAVDYDIEGKHVRAVYVHEVRPYFAENWAVDEPDQRKRRKAVSQAYTSVLKALPPRYHTRREDAGERIWRDF